MFYTIFLSFVLQSVASSVSAASEERCPQWGVIDGFGREGLEQRRYLGRWFRQRSFSSWAEMASKCHSKYYSRKYLDDPYQLITTSDYVSSITGLSHSSVMDVKIEDWLDPTLFTPSLPLLLKQRRRVIATDYDTFTIEYSCSDTALVSRNENVWIYTRRRYPSRLVQRKVKRALRSIGIKSLSKLSKTEQNCDNKLTDPPPPRGLEYEYDDIGDSSIRRNSFEDNVEEAEEEDSAQWKSPVDLARDFVGTLAFVGQAIFAPWTLPGQPFSVDPDYYQGEEEEAIFVDDYEK